MSPRPRVREDIDQTGPQPVETEEHRPADLAEAPPRRARPGIDRSWLILAVVVAVALLGLWLGLGGDPAESEHPERQPVPVRAAAVSVGDLSIVSVYAGEIVGEASDIASQVAGLLQRVPVRIGDRVRAGQLMALVDDVDLRNQLQEAEAQLGVAQANLNKAEAELEGVEADHRRAVDLYSESLLSDQEYDRIRAQLATARANRAAFDAQVEQARARIAILQREYGQTRVTAPFDGTVAARYLDSGALVQRGTPILRLVEDAPLLVQFRVPERDLGAVRPGRAFTVTTQATGERVFEGTVRRISGEVSRTDRSAVVEGELREGSELLRPGMYAEVRVQIDDIDDGLIVPGAAIVERVGMDGTEATGVFVVEAGTASWRDVTVVGLAESRAAIEGGVAAGDEVLTLGHTELRDGSAVRVVQRDGEAVDEAAGEPGPTSGESR